MIIFFPAELTMAHSRWPSSDSGRNWPLLMRKTLPRDHKNKTSSGQKTVRWSERKFRWPWTNTLRSSSSAWTLSTIHRAQRVHCQTAIYRSHWIEGSPRGPLAVVSTPCGPAFFSQALTACLPIPTPSRHLTGLSYQSTSFGVVPERWGPKRCSFKAQTAWRKGPKPNMQSTGALGKPKSWLLVLTQTMTLGKSLVLSGVLFSHL